MCSELETSILLFNDQDLFICRFEVSAEDKVQSYHHWTSEDKDKMADNTASYEECQAAMEEKMQHSSLPTCYNEA